MDLKVKKNVKSKEEIEELKRQVENYKNKYLRALADYQNYEKRVSEDKLAVRQNANRDLLLKMISIVDDLDKAHLFVKDEGLKLIREKFIKIIKDEGVEEMQLVGKEFDPNLAEAIELVEDDKENLVKEVIRKGYIYNDKLLRVAQVKVTKKSVVSS